MLKIEAITYSVEGRPLFEGASATIPTGHKVGLVGRNGSGKTTLFRLIKRELALENGEISLPSRARIGGVAQEVPSSSTSLIDTVLQADTERAALLAEAELASDPNRIAEIQHRLSDIDFEVSACRVARHRHVRHRYFKIGSANTHGGAGCFKRDFFAYRQHARQVAQAAFDDLQRFLPHLNIAGLARNNGTAVTTARTMAVWSSLSEVIGGAAKASSRTMNRPVSGS